MDRPLLTWTEAGLFCEAGGFHIDPHRPVERAVVTHAHSDHARRGCRQYFATETSVGLLKVRLGPKIDVRGVPYGESFQLGAVRVSFHGAGHILGSAQVRVEHQGRVWVASGDYKRDPDPSCEPFEVVPCEVFITEATFGTPKYVWNKESRIGAEMFAWHRENVREGALSLIYGYSLGKTQRILAELALLPEFEREFPFVWIHPTMAALTECYREAGRVLVPTRVLPKDLESDLFFQKELKSGGGLILAPPSAGVKEHLEKFGKVKTAFASGWMQGQKAGAPYRGGSGYDHGFVVSDHADWNDLNRTIDETGARRIFVMHREHGALVRHLRERGLEAFPVSDLEPHRYARIPAKNLELFG